MSPNLSQAQQTKKPSSFSTSPLLPVFCLYSLNQGTLPVRRMIWDRMDGVAQALAVDLTMGNV